jgi:hypothetical protein
MEEERAVHPIVPNKSLDVEGFTFARAKCDIAVIVGRPTIAANRKAPWHGHVVAGARMSVCAPAKLVTIATRHHSVRSVTFRSRKVYWGDTHIFTI